jgi:hypothetical protein
VSLAIVTYVPEGIVMASDSRQSITIENRTPDGKDLGKMEIINSDSVYKTYLLSRKDKNGHPIFEVGVSSFGMDLLGGISIANHVKRFSEEELTDNDDVTTAPGKLFEYFRRKFPQADTGFHLAGYKREGKVSTPFVYFFNVGKTLLPNRKNIKPDGSFMYGASWSGQIDVISGILQPSLFQTPDGKTLTMQKPPIIYDAMALQDAVDFSIFAIRTTIDTIRFQARPKNVGGPIDVLVLTPDGPTWIQKKQLRA